MAHRYTHRYSGSLSSNTWTLLNAPETRYFVIRANPAVKLNVKQEFCVQHVRIGVHNGQDAHRPIPLRRSAMVFEITTDEDADCYDNYEMFIMDE